MESQRRQTPGDTRRRLATIKSRLYKREVTGSNQLRPQVRGAYGASELVIGEQGPWPPGRSRQSAGAEVPGGIPFFLRLILSEVMAGRPAGTIPIQAGQRLQDSTPAILAASELRAAIPPSRVIASWRLPVLLLRSIFVQLPETYARSR